MKKALLSLAIVSVGVSPLFGIGGNDEGGSVATPATNSSSGSPPVITTTINRSGPILSSGEFQQLSAARAAALKANPDLAAESKQLTDEMEAGQDKLNAALIKADPQVAPIVAKLKAMREQRKEQQAAASTAPPGTPPAGGTPITLTPDEMRELISARKAAIQSNPDLVADNKQLSDKMRAFQAKLDAVVVKADPSIAPILAKLHSVNPHPVTFARKTSSVHEIIDVDALAARMKAHQDLYQKIRDESLAVYAKGQSKTPVEEETKTLIRLAAYLWVWGDFYGEGLWRRGNGYAQDAWGHGVQDPLVKAFLEEARLADVHSATEDDAQRVNDTVDQLFASEYPAQLKAQACSIALQNLVNYKTYEHPDPNSAGLKRVQALLDEWGRAYREMIKEKLPHDALDDPGSNLLCEVQNDQQTLDLAIGEIDRDFNEADPANPVKIALDGEYEVDSAWCARGSGWANSVSDQGWQLFKERLDKADEILEAGFAKYPGEGEMARSMINVELGQGQGRDRMETWFQKAIAANPDDYSAYKEKEWYLQPRWYGSVEDVLSFGQECVKTGNWSAKLPMIFTTGVAEISDQDATIYTRSDVWPLVEKTYRDYLDRYPKSTFYRTAFAKHAYDSGRLDIAREQFEILGDDWDRSTVSESDYLAIAAALGLK